MSKNAKQIFMDAVELEPNERPAFVQAACENDAGLVSRVDALLRASEEASSLLGAPPPPASFSVQGDLAEGQTIGVFRLVKEIGSGGFGTVWLAEQQRPFQRLVALKVLKAGMDSKEVVSRFEAERQALALMEHPGIAKVFDAGTTDSARLYFAMELVDGVSITEHCKEHKLGARERVRLIVKVCAALKHAHQRGIIHRDIKPNNVLVVEQDGELQPKVIDFGIAKAVGGRLADSTIMTRVDQIIGTPGYMSPEQIDEEQDIDTRSDIYSVGALLYELLTGAQPIDVTASNLLAIQRKITQEEPPPPSIRLQSEASTSGLTSREVRGDLDWITMSCLEKDRDRRYDSMGVLSLDLQQYLDGGIVSAGPPTLRYRTRKFVHSYWRGLIVAGTVFGLLITGVVVSTKQAHKAQVAENDAKQELVRSKAVAGFLQELLMGIDPAFAKGRDTELIREVLDRASASVEKASENLPEVEANLRTIIGQSRYSIGEISEARHQLELALNLRADLVGKEHFEYYQAAANLGPILGEDGDYEAGVELLRVAYKGLSKELGEDHYDARLARSNLAATLQNIGQLAEAEPLLRLIESDAIADFGAEDERSQRAQNNLATLLTKLGQIEEAKERFEFVAEVQLRTLTIEHPKTMATLNNLAGTHEELGEVAEAERLYRQLLETKVRLLPPGHPSRLIGMNNLAHFLDQNDQREEGAQIRADAIAQSKEHHGIANRFTLTMLVAEGLAQLESKDYELSEAAFRTVLEHAEEVFGAGGSLELTAAGNLAEVLLRTERAEEALEMMTPVIEQLDSAFPESSKVRRAFPARYGLILHAAGQSEEALMYLERARKELPGLGLEKWEERVEAALADLRK